MNRARLLAFSFAGAALAAPIAAAPADPYAALKAMDGRWLATTSGGRTRTIDNHCARGGTFFECEQTVGGKSAALVVFLPQRIEGRGLAFRVQTLTAGADRPGPWRDLIIDGDRWTYGDAARSRGGGRRVRTVDTYSGPDFMHAEIQTTSNGSVWTTTASEDLTRAP